MHSKLFETALGISDPWFVNGIDFVAGTRFPHPEVDGSHPVHDTVVKRYRHLNFFQHDCFLEVRTPRIKLPDSRVGARRDRLVRHDEHCRRRNVLPARTQLPDVRG